MYRWGIAIETKVLYMAPSNARLIIQQEGSANLDGLFRAILSSGEISLGSPWPPDRGEDIGQTTNQALDVPSEDSENVYGRCQKLSGPWYWARSSTDDKEVQRTEKRL